MHAALDSGGAIPVPLTFWLGRLCEEFGGWPSQAIREWRRWPPGFLEQVIEDRHYADAKRQMEGAKKDKDALKRLKMASPLVALAHEIDMELVKESLPNG